MSTRTPMRIAVVEDDVGSREKLARVLESIPDCTVVFCCESAEQALERFVPGMVDVFIVDIGLPGMSGVELVRRLVIRQPGLLVLMWTVFEDREVVVAAIRAGAVGYLTKGDASASMETSLRQVLAGGSPMSPGIARKLIRELQPLERGPSPEQLSPRERHIIRAISEGLSYKEIGTLLAISVHTVHAHIRKVYAKLQAEDRTDALRRAQAIGILTHW